MQGATLLVGFTLIAFSAPAFSLTQGGLDTLAETLDLRYDILTNLDAGDVYKAKLTLKNNGKATITKDGNWAIYFCNIRLVEPDKTTANSTEKYGFRFSHINGCLHKMAPVVTFKDLAPGKAQEVLFKAKHWMVAKTDIMPNWFVAADGLQAKTIKSTAGESLSFVGDFKTKEQWKRFKKDLYDPYSASSRYNIIGIQDLGGEGVGDIVVVPQPLQVTGLDRKSRVGITAEWKVYADQGLQKEADLLKDKFKAQLVQTMPVEQKKLIVLRIGDPDVTMDGKKATNNETYSLVVGVSDEKVTVIGRQAAGVFYGVQTLIGLADDKNTVAKVTIKDSPRYEYRGMHLDVSRNFMGKAAVLKLLDAMATYKLNKFHFHLTDDEGWRLQIPGLDELTTIGSKRCFDTTGTKCLLTQLGSGPSEPATGSHYTVAEYKEILQRAKDLHIQVIPEFDMPGHGYAAIKSMEARYKKYKDSNMAKAKKHLLTEAGDFSKYLSIQYFTDDAINPCLNSTYAFIEKVVSEVKGMHKDIQPLTVFHFGGDEVAKGAWTNSSACESLAQRLGYDFTGSDISERLKEYFVGRVANVTADEGLSLAGWEDGLLGNHDVPYDRNSLRNRDVTAYAWNNIWDWGGGKRAYLLANAGYKVVMTQATHLYFDFPYEPDPQERGYYWATRFTDTRKTFGFMPDNLYRNVEHKLTGEAWSQEELCSQADMCVALNKTDNIIGMAGALWTETVRTADQMDSMIFPRLLALAERAWHKASWEDISDKTERNRKRTNAWQQFANFLGHKELSRLDKKGIKYHLPPPGASNTYCSDCRTIQVKCALPGLPIQFSKDGGKTWADVTDKTEVQGKVKLTTRSADRARKSRLVDFSSASTLVLNLLVVTLCAILALTC